MRTVQAGESYNETMIDLILGLQKYGDPSVFPNIPLNKTNTEILIPVSELLPCVQLSLYAVYILEQRRGKWRKHA